MKVRRTVHRRPHLLALHDHRGPIYYRAEGIAHLHVDARSSAGSRTSRTRRRGQYGRRHRPTAMTAPLPRHRHLTLTFYHSLRASWRYPHTAHCHRHGDNRRIRHSQVSLLPHPHGVREYRLRQRRNRYHGSTCNRVSRGSERETRVPPSSAHRRHYRSAKGSARRHGRGPLFVSQLHVRYRALDLSMNNRARRRQNLLSQLRYHYYGAHRRHSRPRQRGRHGHRVTRHQILTLRVIHSGRSRTRR